jgi:hypothetical protein
MVKYFVVSRIELSKIIRYCFNVIGIDKGNLIKMNQGSFTYSGTKIN